MAIKFDPDDPLGRNRQKKPPAPITLRRVKVGETCPTCGQKVRAKAKSNAQRQREYRKRKREGVS